MKNRTIHWLGVGVLTGLMALPALAQENASEATSSGLNVQEDSGETESPANASQVDSESIEKSGGVGRENAGFTDGGAQTPVDQRPNALTFDQLDVDGDGTISEAEAVSAEQEALYRELVDEQAQGITREDFQQRLGSDQLEE